MPTRTNAPDSSPADAPDPGGSGPDRPGPAGSRATVADVVAALEAAAPRGQAADWDNVGLLVGDAAAPVSRVVCALDLTPAVIREAERVGAQAVVTHHPILFGGAKRVTADTLEGALVLGLARRGIAHVAAHTNLDAAPDGVSVALARALGVAAPRILAPLDDALRKLVVFTPRRAADAVRAALHGAGAGQIGDYTEASFSADGTGRFRPGADATPAIGTAGGGVEAVDEVRLEVLVERWRLGAVVRALTHAHPYQEVAYDVYPVANAHRTVGFGAVGDLAAPVALDAFLTTVADALQADALHVVGDAARPVSRVAVCGGSGMRFLGAARAAGADAFVTADVTYHRFFEALGPDGAPQIALVDAGHFQTERLAERLLVDVVGGVAGVQAQRTATRTSPVRTFVKA